MAELTIPFNFTPRDYQIPLYNCLPQGFKRGMVIWHRRAGKDKTFINILARESFKRVGTYFYILPYYKQARLIIWEGADSDGFRFIDHFPKEVVKRRENQQMVLELENGSIVRLIGSDNIDSIVGANPIGVLLSEFSLHKAAAWNYLRPILTENGGWALFNGTPRGKNAMHRMWRYAKTADDWFTQLLTIEDTYREDGSPIVSEADIELERQSGMPEELIDQEYFCSFDAGLVGTIVGDLIAIAAREDRITRVPWDPNYPVHTAWDLGFDDTNTILFFQVMSREVRFIDCVFGNRKAAGYYVNELGNKPYTYQEHFLPHDVEVHEYSTGDSRRETFENLGLCNITTVPRMGPVGEGLKEGHNAMRQLLPKCVFDAEKTDELLEGLKGYRREWDDKNQVFSNNPVADWAKHFADAFRMAAWGITISVTGLEDSHQWQSQGQYDERTYMEPRSYMTGYNELTDYTGAIY